MERLPEIIIPKRITEARGPKIKLQGVEGEYTRPKVLEFTHKPSPILTNREEDIMQTVIDGNTLNKQIGLHLGIEKQTVKNHVRNIRIKLEKHGHDLSERNPSTVKIKIISALLQEGVLVLKEPQSI